MNIHHYWKATLAQDAKEMLTYFHQDAYVNWHNSNEHFTVDEFIKANCEYPGQWDGHMERFIEHDDFIITVMHVYTADKTLSFHVTSFMQIQEDQILSIDEYWGDDGTAPQWRLDKHIGSPIHE